MGWAETKIGEVGLVIEVDSLIVRIAPWALQGKLVPVVYQKNQPLATLTAWEGEKESADRRQCALCAFAQYVQSLDK